MSRHCCRLGNELLPHDFWETKCPCRSENMWPQHSKLRFASHELTLFLPHFLLITIKACSWEIDYVCASVGGSLHLYYVCVCVCRPMGVCHLQAIFPCLHPSGVDKWDVLQECWLNSAVIIRHKAKICSADDFLALIKEGYPYCGGRLSVVGGVS